MLKTRTRILNQLILDCVSWQEYTRLLRMFEGRHLRLTYDRGRLEIMTLSFEHESNGEFLGQLVRVLTEELNLPIRGGGSTTFRKKKKQKGLEPDNCYWIAHETAVRNIKVINLRKDPPPDLALEIDVTSSSMNRMRIYAAINVPEVWRYGKEGLSFWVLNGAGKYDAAAISPTFPVPISPADLQPFIAMRGQIDDNAVIRHFRAWIREANGSMKTAWKGEATVKTETATLADRITTTPGVCGGDACIRGHRIPVWVLVNYRLQGASDTEVLHMYPTINSDDVVAAWQYYESHCEEIDEAIRENEEGYDEPVE